MSDGFKPVSAFDVSDENPAVVARRLDRLHTDVLERFDNIERALVAIAKFDEKLDVIIDRQNVTDRRVDETARQLRVTQERVDQLERDHRDQSARIAKLEGSAAARRAEMSASRLPTARIVTKRRKAGKK